MKYTAYDGDGSSFDMEVECESEIAGLVAGWVLDGDYYEVASTFWVKVYVRNAKGVEISAYTITVDPPEPKCLVSKHHWGSPHHLVGGLWENPGVFGHGGGVKIHEVCRYCGLSRWIDTWAQNPDTGEQGLTSITYKTNED